jgi:hypothetical protein
MLQLQRKTKTGWEILVEDFFAFSLFRVRRFFREEGDRSVVVPVLVLLAVGYVYRYLLVLVVVHVLITVVELPGTSTVRVLVQVCLEATVQKQRHLSCLSSWRTSSSCCFKSSRISAHALPAVGHSTPNFTAPGHQAVHQARNLGLLLRDYRM